MGGSWAPVQTGTGQVQSGGNTYNITYNYPAGYTGPKTVPPGQTPPTPPPGYTWVPLVSATGNMLAQVLAVSQGMGVQTTPGGGQMVYPAGTKSVLASTTGAGAAQVA